MKNIQFVNRDKGSFTATLRKNVNDYFKEKGISTKGNFNMVLKSIAMLSVYLVPFIIILIWPISGWWIFPLSVIMGIGMSGIGMGVMHDAMHGSFSNKQWLNKLFGNTMYLIGGNTFNWKIQHNLLHHTYTNIDGFDEDIEPKGILRLSSHAPLKKIHRFQHIYAFLLYCLMTISRMVKEFSQLAKYNKSGFTAQQKSSPKKEMTKLALSKATYLGIFLGLPLIFSGFSWWLILLGFLVTHIIAGIFMSIVFQLAHVVKETEQPLPNEQGIIDNEWAIHELETTANFARKSRLFSWIIGGLNYQIEHHLFPHICHIHYKAISPIVESTAKEFGLKYNENRTFLHAVHSHVCRLKVLGRRS